MIPQSNQTAPAAARKPENILYAVFLAVISYLAVSVMGVLVKFLPTNVNLSITLFSQYVVGLILISFFVFRNPGAYLKTKKPWLHLIRISSGVITFALFFISLNYTSLVNSIVLRSTTPFFIPLILLAWKGQRVAKELWFAIVVGFIGVVCIIKPSVSNLNFGSLIALGSGFVMAIAALSVRRLSRTEPPQRTLFYYFLFPTLVLLPFFLDNMSVIQSFSTVALLLGIGFCMFIVQYGLVLAFAYGKTSTLAPIAYTAILFSGLFDWFIWHIVPDAISCLGIALIILAALVILWQQKKQEKQHEHETNPIAHH